VLIAFFGLTGAALDEAFRDSAETAMKERLKGHVYALLAAADEDPSGTLVMPDLLPDPRFSNPGSGLYARVRGEAGGLDWRSPSLLGLELNPLVPSEQGVWRFTPLEWSGSVLLAVSYGVIWEDAQGRELAYTFAVAESMAPLLDEIASFRRTLWLWLGGATLVLLMVQGMVLSWGLAPLRRVASALRRIESGEEERVHGRYPKELQGLTSNLNTLIERSRASQQRYRNSLADLAHSLKTPLAILRGAVSETPTGPLSETVGEQVARMDNIVQHQLQRASAAGGIGAVGWLEVQPVLEKLVRAMQKVYRIKGVDCRVRVSEGTRFQGDEADLMEILGNLLDNAFKYCRQRVDVMASALGREGGRPRLSIAVEDDGEGIAEEKVELVLQRGRRADQHQPGHGIGLSVVDEIVRLYQGDMSIGRAPELGGASIRITI
jgi:two-component system sensor histidine kinase PhoQ